MRAQAGRFLTRRVENPDQIGQAADAARWRVGRSKANRGRKTGHLAVDGRLERCAIIALMRHLTNPEQRRTAHAIDRPETPEWTAVGEDARQLIGQSIADNTRAAYAAALRTLDAAVPVDRQTDATIADHIAGLHAAGAAPASIALVVAAVQFRAKIAGTRSPVGEVARRTLAGIRKEGRDRGRGQARAVTYDQVIRMQAVAGQPRRRGRGMESPEVATRRGWEDAALVGLAFEAGLRRSEIAALIWADVGPAAVPGAVLIHVRASKTEFQDSYSGSRRATDRDRLAGHYHNLERIGAVRARRGPTAPLNAAIWALFQCDHVHWSSGRRSLHRGESVGIGLPVCRKLADTPRDRRMRVEVGLELAKLFSSGIVLDCNADQTTSLLRIACLPVALSENER